MTGHSLIPLDRAARMPAKHALIYNRVLNASVEKTWSIVSTKEGISRWWIVPPTQFELKQGGRFHHHWESTIAKVEHLRLIDIDEPAGAYRGTGGMRFELARIDEQNTNFLFVTTFGRDVVADIPDAQPHGPGTGWADVAAGWHGMVDNLERIFDDGVPRHSENELREFYKSYLDQQFRLVDMVERT
ncbi:MAG: SRPBCC domain-containing protein [Paracoccaceae bacterium]